MSRARRCRATQLRCDQLEAREVPAILHAVTTDQRLITFDSASPGSLLGSVAFSGLSRSGEQITDIDVRPATGELYGRSDDGRIYRINVPTGGATLLGGGVTAAGEAGFDFNPKTDRIRVINTNGENVTVDPDTGAILSIGRTPAYVAGDAFSGITPRLSSVAHTSSTSAPLLYGIDDSLNTLVRSVGSANGAQLVTVGSLGFDVGRAVGFDIDPNGGVAYATFRAQGAQGASFFSVVDLNTGASSLFGTTATTPRIRDLAVSQTQSSVVFLPPFVNPLSFGFTSTNLAATINSIFVPPTTPVTPVTPFPTTPLFPALVQSLNGTLIAPLGPGLVSQPPVTFNIPTFTNFGSSFGSFVVAPQASLTNPFQPRFGF